MAVDLDKVTVLLANMGADRIVQRLSGVSFELPWSEKDHRPSSAAGTVYAEGFIFWSGDIRFDVIDQLRPLIEEK